MKILKFPKLLSLLKHLNLKTLDYAKFMNDIDKIQLNQDIGFKNTYQLII